jgi:hypothetical protein
VCGTDERADFEDRREAVEEWWESEYRPGAEAKAYLDYETRMLSLMEDDCDEFEAKAAEGDDALRRQAEGKFGYLSDGDLEALAAQKEMECEHSFSLLSTEEITQEHYDQACEVALGLRLLLDDRRYKRVRTDAQQYAEYDPFRSEL